MNALYSLTWQFGFEELLEATWCRAGLTTAATRAGPATGTITSASQPPGLVLVFVPPWHRRSAVQMVPTHGHRKRLRPRIQAGAPSCAAYSEAISS